MTVPAIGGILTDDSKHLVGVDVGTQDAENLSGILNGVRGFDSVAEGGDGAGCSCSNHLFNTFQYYRRDPFIFMMESLRSAFTPTILV